MQIKRNILIIYLEETKKFDIIISLIILLLFKQVLSKPVMSEGFDNKNLKAK